MNKLQLVASSITGFCGLKENSGTQNDYYYDECETKEEKLQQIDAMASDFHLIYLSPQEILEIYNYIEQENTSYNERLRAFYEVGKDYDDEYDYCGRYLGKKKQKRK